MSDAKIKIGVAGNPNSGKTTLFNMLTGANQTVGNYPGVTVEKKVGMITECGVDYEFVDLPGSYSMTAYSQEEVVARNYIVDENPDIVLNVVDASNLERNLYLTIQLCEMGVPVIVALNMHDIAVQRGFKINIDLLSNLLGVPIVTTVGRKNKGSQALLKAIRTVIDDREKGMAQAIVYPDIIEQAIKAVDCLICRDDNLKESYNTRWLAQKLLEEDSEVVQRMDKEAEDFEKIRTCTDECLSQIIHEEGEDASTLIAEHRYGYAAGAMRECVDVHDHGETLTDAVDTIVCNRFAGFFFVALVVFITFKLTFLLADGIPFVPWIDGFRTPVGVFAWIFEDWMPSLTADMAAGPLKSLLNDGIIAGVGGVMGFVPLIFFMFFMLALIEDSGYIARIAFVLDRILRTFGLQGKSILAMIVSGGIAGGCAVPGVMATRALREEKDRLTTMLIAPFMSCGAKMPVFAMLIAAFFQDRKGEMLWLIVIISWCFALMAAWLLRKFVIRGEQTPFVMELPPYHLPMISTVLKNALERSWLYLKKAGTIILTVSIVIWALMYFPQADTSSFAKEKEVAEKAFHSEAEKLGLLPAELSPENTPEELADASNRYSEAVEKIDARAEAAQLRQSVAGRVGRFFEPVSKAAGFDWKDNIALIGGFAAKEIIVSTMSMAYSMGEAEGTENIEESKELPLVQSLRKDPAWTPLRAFAMILFVLLYAPCLVTVATIWRESGSFKWALFSTAYSTAIAFLAATAVYRIGRALSIGV